mgnify:CR=1 FL=1
MGLVIAFVISHTDYLLAALVAYFCGCFNGAILTSRLFFHDDVRRHGSGNAGLTNFYRNYGAKYAPMVIAFDMLKADWLPPKGTGEVADVVVTRLPRRSLGYVSLKDGRSGEAYEDVLRVEFPGEGNGIREVTPLKGCDLLVRHAPLEGYERFWEERWGRDLKFDLISTESLDRCQCFRIRAHKDADGKCVGGYYGKIYEGFSFSGPGVPKGAMAIDSFSYTYFLNPAAGDRNLEFNGKNLNPETRHVLWRNR